jgi:hypothetical protein
LKVPSITVSYYDITPRWSRDDAQEGYTGTFWKKSAGANLSWRGGLSAQSSTYRDPIFIFGNEVHNAQNWSLIANQIGGHYWWFNTVGIMDDFTGQLIFGGTKSEGPPISDDTILAALPSRTNTWDMRADADYSTTGMGLSQLLYVGRAGGRIRVWKQTDTSHLDDYPQGSILKHTHTTNLGDNITAHPDSLEQTLGIFQVVLTTDKPAKVDTAQEVPTVVYDIPQEVGQISNDFAASITNEEGTFYTHADPKPVFEGKTFSLPLPGTFPTVSGEFNPLDYQRFIGISNSEGILASEYNLDTPWVNMVTVASGVIASGLITHFETSNFAPEGTYFFYTVSGVKSFFQKNGDENFWRDYSIGLPDSPITIIRVDDLI